MLNGLDLFSGIGGITLALSEWVRPIAYCECNRYAQAVLLSRMADGTLPSAPIWDDVTSLRGTMLPSVDIVYGGFPCQDISLAGVGCGLEGERSKLFYEVTRLVGELRPQYVFLENVAAIVVRGLGDVLGAFTELRYDCRWTVNRASDFGATHHRARWWLLANSHGERCQPRVEFSECQRQSETTACSKTLADTDIERLEIGQQGQPREQPSPFGGSWWESEPSVGRVVNGLPNRVDRIKALGNSVVPLQAREAFKELIGL